jgi:hypothetical protein
MNSFRIRQAKHQSPSEEVVRDGHGDLVVTGFQHQRHCAILERASPVGKFPRSFLIEEVLICEHERPVQEDPRFAGPANIDLLRLFPVRRDRRLQPCDGSVRIVKRQAILSTQVDQPAPLRADGLPLP